MATSDVHGELIPLLKIKRAESESDEQAAWRAALDLTPEQWNGLKDESKTWVNEGLTAVFSELSTELRMRLPTGVLGQKEARDFALRAFKAPDEKWSGLSWPTQIWVNKALESDEKKEQLPALDGWVSSPPLPSPSAAEKNVEAKTTKAEGKMAKTATAKKAAPPVRAKKTNGNGQKQAGRPGKFPDDAKIKILKPNPHREGTKDHVSYKTLKSGMTVAAAREKASDPAYLSWAVRQGIIAING